jgi:AAA domain
MLPTHKTPPKRNLHDLTVLAYGPHKFGKSSWCAQADDALFLATEPGLNHLEVYQQPISTWDELLVSAREIAEGKHAFRTVIIDTVDNAYRICAEYICQKYKVEHESDLDYGKGYALVNAEFHRVLNKLALLPYGLFLVSHSQEKEIETRTGKYTKIVPTLPDKARKLVLGLVDIILFCDLEPMTGPDGKPAYRRILRTKPSAVYEAGDRTGRLPEVLDLDFAAFAAAFAQGAPGPAVPAAAAPTISPTSRPTADDTAGTVESMTAAIDATVTRSPGAAAPVSSPTSSEPGITPPTTRAGSTASTAATATSATAASATSPRPPGPDRATAARPRTGPVENARPAPSSPRARTTHATTQTTTSAASRPRTTSTPSR